LFAAHGQSEISIVEPGSFLLRQVSIMTIDFYYTSGGPFAWRCLLALEAKALVYTPHLVDLSKQENRTAEFLALNARGTLPLLKEGPIVVRESQAIMFFLDCAHPATPLYGETPADAARVMQEICEQASYLEGPLRAIIGPLLFAQNGGDLTNVPRAAAALRDELRALDGRLCRECWMAGETLSAADLNLYPFLASLERALLQPSAARLDLKLTPITDRFPHIGRWMRAIQALHGYERTEPMHWN
jgi:glutathione S-transferase